MYGLRWKFQLDCPNHSPPPPLVPSITSSIPSPLSLPSTPSIPHLFVPTPPLCPQFSLPPHTRPSPLSPTRSQFPPSQPLTPQPHTHSVPYLHPLTPSPRPQPLTPSVQLRLLSLPTTPSPKTEYGLNVSLQI